MRPRFAERAVLGGVTLLQVAERPKVIQLIDRSKLPTREREVKQYRFLNRLNQAIGQARARLQSQAREKSAADQPDAKT